MKALCLLRYGSLDHLKLAELPEASPGAGQVRVKVHASSLNPADFKVALAEVKFLHGRKFPLVLGYDFSGVIDALGTGVADFKIGDPVYGFLPYGPFNNQGAFGEKLLAKRAEIARKPEGVSHEQAAASATAGLTAIQAIRDVGKLAPRGRVLVTGVSGGVGSIALQVAIRLGAAEVVAVGSGKGLEEAKRLGATQVIDRKRQDVFAAATGAFDLVFDAAAAYRWKAWRGKLKPGGQYVTTLPSLSFAMDKLASLLAGTRAGFVTVKSRDADLKLLAEWLGSGLQFPLDATIPAREVPRALERLRRGEVLGKIAVDVLAGM